MTVSVTLFGDLRKYVSRGSPEVRTVSLAEDSTVADLLRLLGVPAEEEVTPGLNGERASRETVLHDGDAVLLFGPMEGG